MLSFFSVRAPIPQKRDTLIEPGYEDGYATATQRRNQARQSMRVKTVFDGFRDFGKEASKTIKYRKKNLCRMFIFCFFTQNLWKLRQQLGHRPLVGLVLHEALPAPMRATCPWIQRKRGLLKTCSNLPWISCSREIGRLPGTRQRPAKSISLSTYKTRSNSAAKCWTGTSGPMRQLRW